MKAVKVIKEGKILEMFRGSKICCKSELEGEDSNDGKLFGM